MDNLWTERIIDDQGSMLGKLRGKNVANPNFSRDFRYLPIIAHFLENAAFRTALTTKPVIADFAVGQAHAMVGFMQKLKEQGLAERVDLHVFDKDHPVYGDPHDLKFKLDTLGLNPKTVGGGYRNLTREPNPYVHYTLGIIGFANYYLDKQEFTTALVNRARECDYLTVIPATPWGQSEIRVDGWIVDNTQTPPQLNYVEKKID